MKKMTRKKGYVTLISVLIVGAVGIAIAVSLILLGLGSSRNSLVLQQSIQAKALANSCAEEALQILVDSPSFSGNGTLTIDNNACSYTVTPGGFDTTVTASGTVGAIVRKINVIVNPNGVSWQEVS
jgi:hypothetical protein